MSSFDQPEFSGIYPVSFLMRESHRSHWFRIHSLPESKRYPETQEDWAILKERHKALTSAMLEEGSPCRISYTLFDDSGVPELLKENLTWSEPFVSDYDGDEVFTQIAEGVWRFEEFWEWIRLRSDDELGWISFHSLTTDSIYSPYDGGADIFCLDPFILTNNKSSFSKWASQHPTGQ